MFALTIGMCACNGRRAGMAIAAKSASRLLPPLSYQNLKAIKHENKSSAAGRARPTREGQLSFRTTLIELKTVTGEQIGKKEGINPLWVYEKTTKALAKAEMITGSC